MSRRKSTVVLPQPAATSVLRRSARLVSLQNRVGQEKPVKDLVFGSEPPRKIRRELGPQVSSKRLVYSSGGSSSKKSPGSNSSIDGFSSLRRSLRVSNREFSDSGKDKSPPCSSTKPASTSTNVSCSCSLRRSPRFSSGGGSFDRQSSSDARKSGNSVLSRCSKKSISFERGNGGDGVKSRDRSRSLLRPKTKQMFRGCDNEEVSVCLSKRKRMRIAKPNEKENAVPKAVEGKRIGKEEEEKKLKSKNKLEVGWAEELELASCTLRRSPRFSSGGASVDSSSKGRKSSNSDLSRRSRKSFSSEREKGGDGIKSRDRSRSGVLPKTKPMFRGCDDEEEEVSVCLSEEKNMRIAKPNKKENAVPKAGEGKRIGKKEEEEGLKKKNKLEVGWTEELELALQGAYLTMKPSPNFWKKVSKMVPGKSAQECFDRVNSDLITPRQPQPRSRASKSNLSTIPQFSLSASKLLKPNSPKTKIRHRRNNLSKKTIRHLLEKQNHMDQGLGFDLFSVFEPSTTSSLLSTPVEKGQRLPKILESPLPCSRFASKDKTTMVSPPVLKQVKNKALHEKYIDHLHIREAKRKAESTRMARKENIRPIDDNQKKDSVRAVKDALFFDVQDAIQKLKGLEAENSSSSSEFCYDRAENDEEDESI